MVQDDQKQVSKNQFLNYNNNNNDNGYKSVDSDGQDSSSFQIGNNGIGQVDESQFMGAGANNHSQIDNLIQKHQDATLNRNHWVPDQKARGCFKCSKDFTFFYRKHHCRICGNVFCHNCTTVKAIISNGKLLINQSFKGIEQKNNLREFDEPIIATVQDQNDLQKIRMIQKEIDNMDNDIKKDGFNKLLSALEEEKYDYTGSIQIQESQNIDKINYSRLRDFSNFHVRNIVLDIMKSNQIDIEKWGCKLLEFVSTAVDNVKPSSRLLGDSMNFNTFIKIKIINYADNSKSAYINGIVMCKNLADKRMANFLQNLNQNPQILLLKDSLGQNKSDTSLYMADISTVIDQEEYQVNIIKQKLTQVQPNLIIVEKDVSYKVLDALTEAKIFVITNLDAKKMRRVARQTQTIISPSYNVVDKSFVLGKCKSVRVEKPYTANLIKNFNQVSMENIQVLHPNNQVSNERSLIYFEGCNPALGCTILLSGNIQTEISELRRVKASLQEMLKLARNVILERAFLMQLNCLIPKSIGEDCSSINALESPFLITRNILNRQTLVLSKVIMKKGLDKDKILTQASAATQYNMVNSSHQFSQQQIQNMLAAGVGNVNDDISMAPNCHEQLSQMTSPQGQILQTPNINPTYQQLNPKVNEQFVKNKMDQMCGCPKKEKMTFYKKDSDKSAGDETIGNMLKKLFNNSQKACEYCKEPMLKHFIQYYHRDGCIEIELKLLEKNDNKKQTQTVKPKEVTTQKKRDIIMSGFCQICNKQVTPDIPMSNQFYEYSTARFFEQFFYNGDKLYNFSKEQGISCSHRSLRDIQRIFIFPKGFSITFKFTPLDVYTIEMLQPKTQDTSDTFNQEIDKRKRAIEAGIHSANEDLKTRIQSVLEFIKNQKKQIFTKEQQKFFIQQNTNIPIFIQPLKYIKQRLGDLEKEISRIVQIFALPLHEVDTIFGILFLERKVLVNFLTFSRLLDEISKVSCLLIVMLSLRVNILKQQQQQIMNLEIQFESSVLLAANLEQINELVINRQITDTPGQERSTQVQNVGSIERATLANIKSKTISNLPKSDYDLLFSELFQTSADVNQTMQQVIISILTVCIQNQTLLGQGQSKQIGTQNIQSAINIEPIKQILKDKVHSKLEDLYFDYQNDKRQAKILEITKIREGSIHQNQKQNSQQILHNNADNGNWMEILKNGYTGMPLGSDNLYVPLKENDIGSLISFVLASNIYKEAMIKQNYMDISQKIKVLGKHPRQPGQFPTGLAGTGNTDVNPTPIGIRESTINLQGFAQQAQFQTQNTFIGNNTHNDETIKLLGKNDVFNSDLSAHQIETELLCGERLYFLVKFSTDKIDLSLKMVKNSNVAKLKQTSLTFTTGEQVSNKKKNKKVRFNDFQDNVCPQISKDYLDNSFYKDSVTELDKVIGLLNVYYFQQGQQYTQLQNQSQNFINAPPIIISPPRTIATVGSQFASQDDSQNFDLQTDQQHFNNIIEQHQQPGPSIRESMNANFLNSMKSPPMINITVNQTTPQMNSLNNIPLLFGNSESQDFCGIKSPLQTLNINPNEALRQELQAPRVDFELKIYFPKKFEALRRFYCGSQYDFIKSLLKTKEWSSVSGGKSSSKFYRSFDDKYVYKEIKKVEFKMFLEFAPQYFDYLCKSFFHNYPCALCKILGAYKIKIIVYKNGRPKITKKYLYITENLNFGIKPEDESQIIRYDLKGSKNNRFVKNKEGRETKAVLHDNNFLLELKGRPLPIRYTINRILHICINNDTLCLSKSNIVDYSLLTIIDTKRKKVRFGIIDFVQQYTLDKIFESKFKNIINGGESPTIVDPEKYKQRFKKAMKSYFVGMCIQEEKVSSPQLKTEQNEAEEDYSDDDDDFNETTINKLDKEKEEQSMQQVSMITASKHDIIENDNDVNI